MNESSPRFWEVFFEVYESLPRQGPGNRACAEKALGLCSRAAAGTCRARPRLRRRRADAPSRRVLPSALIMAIDSHAPSIERLRADVAERGLAERVRPMVGDMAHPGLPPESFDLIWSEGALYNIGIENALRICHGLLRPAATSPSPTRSGARRTRRPRSRRASTSTIRPWARVSDVLAAISKARFLARRPLHPAGRGLVGRFLHADGESYRGVARKVRRRCRGARRARSDRAGARDAPAALRLLRLRVLHRATH